MGAVKNAYHDVICGTRPASSMGWEDYAGNLRTYRSVTPAQLEQGANEIVLAADGNIRRADALRFARAAAEGFGMEFRK